MIFRDCVRSTDFEDVFFELVNISAAAKADFDNYKDMLSTLKFMEPEYLDPPCEIIVSRVEDDAGSWYNISGRQQLPDAPLVSLSLTTWEQWLGLEVNEMAGLTEVHFVAHCLLEMSMSGFSPEATQSHIEMIQHMMEDLDGSSSVFMNLDEIFKEEEEE